MVFWLVLAMFDQVGYGHGDYFTDEGNNGISFLSWHGHLARGGPNMGETPMPRIVVARASCRGSHHGRDAHATKDNKCFFRVLRDGQQWFISHRITD